jgi:hypothetical protein
MNNSVAMLKKAIKEEKSLNFNHIPADFLTLWKVSILSNHQLTDDLSLMPTNTLLDTFPTELERRNVHIITDGCPHPGEW